MPEPDFDQSGRDEWDEYDWEIFLRRADARIAKFQELFETLSEHPDRAQIIAREMGWEQEMRDCLGNPHRCPLCDKRSDCEVYEMLRLMAQGDSIQDDPDAVELLACFEQLREIPAYVRAQNFATRLEETLVPRLRQVADRDEMRAALLSAQMVPAQIAGGHGIGYERDSLCGNIASCKRALKSLEACLEQLKRAQCAGMISPDEANDFASEAKLVSLEICRWIENLRARIWWR